MRIVTIKTVERRFGYASSLRYLWCERFVNGMKLYNPLTWQDVKDIISMRIRLTFMKD